MGVEIFYPALCVSIFIKTRGSDMELEDIIFHIF